MSRVGNLPITIPAGVTVNKLTGNIEVLGPKGNLKMDINPSISVEIEGNLINVARKSEERKIKALHGLTRNLIANMIAGVTEGWSKNLELVGVGFRAQGSGNKLTLNVGYSHPVEIEAPQEISFEVSENTKIKVSGIDKQLVGQIAANVHSVRKPDVYKGKGVRYEGEYIKKKLGKSGKVGVAGSGGGGK